MFERRLVNDLKKKNNNEYHTNIRTTDAEILFHHSTIILVYIISLRQAYILYVYTIFTPGNGPTHTKKKIKIKLD